MFCDDDDDDDDADRAKLRCPACRQLVANQRSLKTHVCNFQQLSTAEVEDVRPLGGGEFRRSSSRSRSRSPVRGQSPSADSPSPSGSHGRVALLRRRAVRGLAGHPRPAEADPTLELQQLRRALQMNDDPRRMWGYRDWDWTCLIMSGGLSHETTKLALANEHAHVQNAHHPLHLHSKAQLQHRLVALLEGLRQVGLLRVLHRRRSRRCQ